MNKAAREVHGAQGDWVVKNAVDVELTLPLIMWLSTLLRLSYLATLQLKI